MVNKVLCGPDAICNINFKLSTMNSKGLIARIEKIMIATFVITEAIAPIGRTGVVLATETV